jgi:hypothetical protein
MQLRDLQCLPKGGKLVRQSERIIAGRSSLLRPCLNVRRLFFLFSIDKNGEKNSQRWLEFLIHRPAVIAAFGGKILDKKMAGNLNKMPTCRPRGCRGRPRQICSGNCSASTDGQQTFAYKRWTAFHIF